MSTASQSNMWTQVRRLFAAEVTVVAESVPAETRSPRPAPDARPADPGGAVPDDGGIEARIGEILAQRPEESNLVGGKINLLNLGEIKNRLGPKWPRYEEQVHHFVAKTLERRLTDKDFFTRNEDDTYVILFHDGSEAEARLKCALLGKEISDKFFGELGDESGGALQVETVLATVDGGVAKQGIRLSDAIGQALAAAEAAQGTRSDTGSLTVDEIQRLLGDVSGRFEELEGPGKDEDGPLLVQDRFHELIRQLSNIENVLAAGDQTWAPLPEQAKERRDPTAAWEGRQDNPLEAIRRFVERAECGIERAKAAGGALAKGARSDAPELDLRTSYLPLWSVAHQRVGLYLCQTSVAINQTELDSEIEFNDDIGIKILDAVDRITLRRARSELQSIVSRGMSCLIVVPIHFDTLNRPASAQRYLPVCHAIPKELRQLIVWEIRGAPLVKWTTNFSRIVEQLRALGRAVFILAHPHELPPARLDQVLAKLQGIGIQGAGLDLGCDVQPEAATMAYVNRFAEAAEKHKLTSYLLGLETLSLCTAATCAGISHLAGHVIAHPLAAPQGVQQKALLSLYRSSIQAAADNAL